MGVVGIIVPQLPGAAFRSPADYAEQLAILRARMEPSLGAPLTDLFDALGLFRVFSAWWFTAMLALLAISIVVCTLDRTPGLWRSARDVRVVQPDAFFDPDLPDRAVIADGLRGEDVHAALRRSGFRVREEEGAGGARFLYGDRNQNAKLFTLLTHAGLVGFILAAAITSRFGFETGILLPEGQALPVESIGSAGLVSVKSLGFTAPRDADGRFTDFTTDLAVYRDGQEIARKVIRVNDPLTAAGYTFHQNFFGPAVDLTIRDGAGRLLWAGPVPLDEVNGGRPYGRFTIPGREEGLEMLLGADAAAPPRSPWSATGSWARTPTAGRSSRRSFVGGAAPGRTYVVDTSDLRITFEKVAAFSGVIVKRDPGAVDRLGQLPPADRGPCPDLLLPAAADLGAPRRNPASCGSWPGPIATWTSDGSSGGCWRTWWRGGAPPDGARLMARPPVCLSPGRAGSRPPPPGRGACRAPTACAR